MADVASKLIWDEGFLIVLARAVEEYIDPRKDGKFDWESVFTRAGVHEVTAEEAEAWTKWNFVQNRVESAETMRKWLEDQGREVTDYFSFDFEGYFTVIPAGGITAVLQDRFDTSDWAKGKLDNDFTRTMDDEDYWKNKVLEYQGEVGRVVPGDLTEVAYYLKLDSFAHFCNRDLVAFPDVDQYCAMFIFYKLLSKLGIEYPDNDQEYPSLLDRVINSSMKRRLLRPRRTGEEWAKWWVGELFHNPGAGDYFHANEQTITRIQYEVLRQGRSCNWWGVLTLQKLNNLVTNGWSWSMGIKRCLPSLSGLK